MRERSSVHDHGSDRGDAGMIRLAEGTLVVLIGPAGSGKSSWAAEHFAPGLVGDDRNISGWAIHFTAWTPRIALSQGMIRAECRHPPKKWADDDISKGS
jgi:hypothetical protein